MKKSKSVEEYIHTSENWREEISELRDILRSTVLDETLKWGVPTYMYKGKNIVGIGAFKSYFGLWFFQGALLQDKNKVLLNAQEGKTKALRQWRFTGIEEINSELIKTYIQEAILCQDEGKEIRPNLKKALVIPPELEQLFIADKMLKKRFEDLNLSSKRAFAEYISEAKRASTKMERLKKITPMILNGQGLHDKYKKT